MQLMCTLVRRDGAGMCHPVRDCEECQKCGWEVHEARRRLEALRSEGVKRDGQTGLYRLYIRRKPEKGDKHG